MFENDDEKEAPKARRPILSKLGKKKPTTTIRRPADDLDEIDERELDQVSGGRMYKIDF